MQPVLAPIGYLVPTAHDDFYARNILPHYMRYIIDSCKELITIEAFNRSRRLTYDEIGFIVSDITRTIPHEYYNYVASIICEYAEKLGILYIPPQIQYNIHSCKKMARRQGPQQYHTHTYETFTSEYSETEPAATVVEPPATVAEPAATVAEPAATVAEPAATVVEPPATEAEPAATVAEPSATVVEPPATVVEPPTTVVEPTATKKKISISSTSKPVSNIDEAHVRRDQFACEVMHVRRNNLVYDGKSFKCFSPNSLNKWKYYDHCYNYYAFMHTRFNEQDVGNFGIFQNGQHISTLKDPSDAIKDYSLPSYCFPFPIYAFVIEEVPMHYNEYIEKHGAFSILDKNSTPNIDPVPESEPVLEPIQTPLKKKKRKTKKKINEMSVSDLTNTDNLRPLLVQRSYTDFIVSFIKYITCRSRDPKGSV